VDFHGLDESYLTNYVKNVMAVTPEQVQQITQKYIDPQKMTVVVVGDRSKVESQLTDYKPAVNCRAATSKLSMHTHRTAI
jgi:predicted Zn-dependent peptidase